MYITNLARVEGDSGDGVEVAFKAFSQSESFNGGGLKHEVQERVLHLQHHTVEAMAKHTVNLGTRGWIYLPFFVEQGSFPADMGSTTGPHHQPIADKKPQLY